MRPNRKKKTMADRSDESLALEKKKVLDQEKGAEELNEIFSDLLPWTLESIDTSLLKDNTVQDRDNVERFLDSLFLLRVGEISVSSDAQDVADLVYKRHQAAIVAAYQSDYTLATIISGNGGGTVDIFLGVRSAKDKDVKEVFCKQLEGVYPGKGIRFEDESNKERILKNRLQGQKHGGILTGVPIQKIDDEKQTFDLTSVIRSMNAKKFLLAIVSRPVAKHEAAQQLHELMALKDRCHALASRAIDLNENIGINKGHMEGKTGGNLSPTIFGSLSKTAGINLSGAGNSLCRCAAFWRNCTHRHDRWYVKRDFDGRWFFSIRSF